MSTDAREQFVERIIETNYYLTQAMLAKDTTKIDKYKKELDNLVQFILTEEK